MISKQAAPSPRHIAAGLGDASRQEICGLLALLEAARLSKIAGAVGEVVRRKLVSGDKLGADCVTAFASDLVGGPLSTNALRLRLWLGVKQGLGLVKPSDGVPEVRRDSDDCSWGSSPLSYI